MAGTGTFCLSGFLCFLRAIQCIILESNLIDPKCEQIVANDKDRLQFALNVEFLEAEFFLNGALGRGLNEFAPELTLGGPPPIGAKKANLDPFTRRIIEEFIGHLWAIEATMRGVPRPELDLISTKNFAKIFDQAIGYKLDSPFNPYSNTLIYILASCFPPYVGLLAYVGTIPDLANHASRRLAAPLLGVEAGQDAVLRTLLHERAEEKVEPYDITVADFTDHLCNLRNKLAMYGIKDEGLIVPPELGVGVDKRIEINILSTGVDSLSYERIEPPEILRIVYATGNEQKPGGFLPYGGTGKIAKDLLVCN